MIIRPVKPEDWTLLLVLMGDLHEYVGAMYEFIPVWETVKDVYADNIKRQIADKDGAILVAEKDGTLTGYIVYWIECSDDIEYKPEHMTYGYIKEIYLAPEARGQGIGEQLMDKAFAYFRERGVKLAQLHVVTQNTDARAFYEGLGFKNGALALMKEL